jgi:hypothetical protein
MPTPLLTQRSSHGAWFDGYQELTSAILGTALNPDSVSPLGTSFNDPVSASDLNTVASKLDELIGALKRNP